MTLVSLSVPVDLSSEHSEVEKRRWAPSVRGSRYPRNNLSHHDAESVVDLASGRSGSSSHQNMKGTDERGALRVHNVGGSLTFLLQIALMAFCVRQLRSVLARRRDILSQRKAQLSSPHRPVAQPLFVTISPVALSKLLHLDSTSYLIIDVSSPRGGLTDSLCSVRLVNIPESELKLCLQFSNSQWKSRFPSAKHPVRGDLLLFLSTTGRRAERAATAAAELGYSGCCVVEGGLAAYFTAVQNPEAFPAKLLSRDAVAALLVNRMRKEVCKLTPLRRLLLVDVRRHDERAFYGFIKGSVHLPVEEWPRALAMESLEWERQYRFQKFCPSDIIVLHCRTSRRASWAAQLAYDAGLRRCYVYSQGCVRWRLESSVLAYDSYATGDPPPEPVELGIESENYEAGDLELAQEGLN